jgi:hypothetical protein
MARTKMQIKKDYETLEPKIQADFKTLIEKLQKLIACTQELNTIGDDAQLKKIDLQDKLQKQQQFVQTISNIMKNQQDTLKSIINNLK